MKHIKFGQTHTAFTGKIFTIKHQEVTMPNGEKNIFEFCERPASVSIMALDHKNRLLMIKEYRYGYKKNVWFLPGGRADVPGETPKQAAHREFREETGYRAKKLKLMRKNAPSNTLLWDIYVYAAQDLELDPRPLAKDIGEHTEVVFIPLKKAVQMALDGTIDNEFISYDIIRFAYMLKHKEFVW